MSSAASNEDETVPAEGYLALKAGGRAGFSYGKELDSLQKWLNGSTGEETNSVTSANAPTIVATNPLKELMDRAADQSLALSELVFAIENAASLLTSFLVEIEIVRPVSKDCEVIDDSETGSIFALSADHLNSVSTKHKKLGRIERGFEMMPSALIMTAVATFDSLMADLVRCMISQTPERFISSDKTFPVRSILDADSFEEFKERVVDDEVYSFSREGHDKQVKMLETWFGAKLSEGWQRWADFIEIFERRNLIAHGEKVFTKRYVENCSKAGDAEARGGIGEEITLSRHYLTNSVRILSEFSIISVFLIWRKQFPTESQDATDAVNENVYKFISQQRYRVAIDVIDFVLNLKGSSATQSSRMMMTVNLASAYMHADRSSEAIALLDSVDWSAAANNFKICVAALRIDIEEVSRLMPILNASGEMGREQYREWPVFDFVRDDPTFQTCFLQTFGAQLTQNVVADLTAETFESSKEVKDTEAEIQ